MSRRIDMSGEKFCRWSVLRYVGGQALDLSAATVVMAGFLMVKRG